MITTIAALEALTADALKLSDDATFDRLREQMERCEELIAEEVERRNSESDIEANSMVDALEAFEEQHAQHMAEYQARREARRKTIEEAIGHCYSNPALQQRLRDIFKIVT